MQSMVYEPNMAYKNFHHGFQAEIFPLKILYDTIN